MKTATIQDKIEWHYSSCYNCQPPREWSWMDAIWIKEAFTDFLPLPATKFSISKMVAELFGQAVNSFPYLKNNFRTRILFVSIQQEMEEETRKPTNWLCETTWHYSTTVVPLEPILGITEQNSLATNVTENEVLESHQSKTHHFRNWFGGCRETATLGRVKIKHFHDLPPTGSRWWRRFTV